MLLRTLGGLALEGSAFHRPVPLLLLAFLAVEGPKTRRELADLFFMDARDPRDSLSTTLRRLQQGAPGSIDLEGEKVLTGLPCDALELLAVQEARAAAEVIGLYCGPFLQGLDVPLGVELEEWLFSTRERLGGKLRDAHLRLADEATRLGAVTTAAQHVEAALSVAEAPELESEAHQRLQGLLEASRQSRIAALSVRPDENGSTLPAYATAFVGREWELHQIKTLLADPACRLLTLHGAGGIGKSRVAARAAEEALRGQQFQDGAAFVELSAFNSALQVLPAIASSVGCVLQGQGEELEQVTRFLTDKHLLLVLDNYEHLMEAAVLPAKLLAACPDLKLLVTSREPLNLQEEHVLTLAGLAVPDQGVTLENARQADAVRLFLQRAKQARLDKALPEKDLPHVIKVCALVQGSPLAIELTAAWVRALPISDIAAEISGNLDFLTSSARYAVDRHRSIRVVFEHSWTLLQEAERTALRRLAVFRGGFGRDTAARVAEVTLPLLASLVDKSLLRVNEEGRYGFHPLVQQYAQEKLLEHPEEDASVRERHAAYFLEFLNQQGAGFLGNEQGEALVALERELENLRAAWGWAVHARQVDALRFASPLLRQLMDRRARYREGLQLLEGAEAILSPEDKDHHAALGRLSVDLAVLVFRLGDLQRATHLALRGRRILERLEDAAGVLDGLNTLGGIMWRKGDYVEARLVFERALETARSLSDERNEANCLAYLALAEQELGNFVGATRLYERSLDLCRKIGHLTQAVIVSKNYGNLLRIMGDLPGAKRLLQEGLDLAAQTNFQRMTPAMLTNLALTCLGLEQVQEARSFAERAVAMAGRSGIRAYDATALLVLGRIATASRDYRQAETHIVHGLAQGWSMKSMSIATQALVALGELRVAQGRHEEAVDLLLLACHQPSTEPYSRNLAQALLERVTPAPHKSRAFDTSSQSMNNRIEIILREAQASAS